MPRGARLDAPGTLHHVMARGIEKRNIFIEDSDRKAFLSRLGKLALSTATDIYAWALMDNHVHILLKSGPSGIAQFMRRLLTGYATMFNRTHNRCGHLFQNRYKSIVCEEEAYFLTLVGYIHLNPLRAGMLGSLDELDHYPWTGHSTIIHHDSHSWQQVRYVLEYFTHHSSDAVEAYRTFLREENMKGEQPDLDGGGVFRSYGGWSEVQSIKKRQKKLFSDERILGSSTFVRQMCRNADAAIDYQLPAQDRKKWRYMLSSGNAPMQE